MAFTPGAAPAAEGAAGFVLAAMYVVAIGLLWTWRHTLGDVLAMFARWAHDVSVGVSRFSIHPLRPIADAAEWLDKAVDNALSYAANHTERGMAMLLHLAAHQLAWIGNEIGGLAFDVAQRLENLGTVTIPNAVTRATHAVAVRIGHVEKQVAVALTATIPAIQRRIGLLDRLFHDAIARLQHGIDRIGHVVTVELPHAIGRVTSRVGRLEKAAEHDAARLKHIEGLLTAAGVAALVDVAFRTLRVNWIRCPALTRIGKKHGCTPWHLLEDALGGTFLALEVSDLCRWTSLMEGAAEAARPLFLELVDVENALIGCHGNTAAKAIPLAAYVATPVVQPVAF